ncbi:TPA: hypothetical protein QCU33_005820 [Bacillus cereus]|nr:hypothetical protein [Bacillus cereus]
MEAVVFEVLESYELPTVYFYEHDRGQSCLVAIPSWNWSFLMSYLGKMLREGNRLWKREG